MPNQKLLQVHTHCKRIVLGVTLIFSFNDVYSIWQHHRSFLIQNLKTNAPFIYSRNDEQSFHNLSISVNIDIAARNISRAKVQQTPRS